LLVMIYSLDFLIADTAQSRSALVANRLPTFYAS